MNTSLQTLIDEALSHEADAFDNDTEVSGADLVEWFAGWRSRVKDALDAVNRSIQGESDTTPKIYRVTAGDLGEAIDALKEAAEARRETPGVQEKHALVNRLIADRYDEVACKLGNVKRILERDQTALQPNPTRRTAATEKRKCRARP